MCNPGQNSNLMSCPTKNATYINIECGASFDVCSIPYASNTRGNDYEPLDVVGDFIRRVIRGESYKLKKD